MRDIYELYTSCFPEYPVTFELFCSVLCPEKAQIFRRENKGELIGFAMVHGSSIVLLCVKKAERGNGIGSDLLREAEVYIKQSSGRVVLGQGPFYLLQGVPESEENIRFFSKRGYCAQWTSVNMSLDLAKFDMEKLEIPPAPEGTVFRMFRDSDLPALMQAVEDAHPSWQQVYQSCTDPVLVAELNGKIVGFEILAPDGGRFADKNEKVGAIGCVGVVHSCRRRGIGLQMVAQGARWLKEQNCSSIELRYVELVEWYEKLRFTVARRQWMGEK